MSVNAGQPVAFGALSQWAALITHVSAPYIEHRVSSLPCVFPTNTTAVCS